MTDKPKKTQTKSTENPERRLLRSPDERMAAGVAGGLANYLNIDPTFVRLGFVAAALFGGFGVLAYLVMAVVVPEDDGTGRPVRGRRPPTWALILLGIAILVVLPGPFGGWGDGWFLGVGALWVGALVLAGAGAYRAIRGHWPGQRGTVAAQGKPESRKPARAGRASAGSEQTTEVQGAVRDPGPPRVVRVLAYVALGALALGAALGVAAVGAWATATGNGSAVAGLVIALGVALAATAFFGDGARRATPWLLAVALVLAIPAGAVAAADIRFDGAVGERDYSPSAAEDIPADGYELGVGQLKVDLRELDWRPGQIVPLRTELGVGQMVVSVPSNVCVTGEANLKAGQIDVRGDGNGGIDPEFVRGEPDGRLPTLALDADQQIGHLVVTDRNPEEFSDQHDGPGDRSPDELAPEPAGCG